MGRVLGGRYRLLERIGAGAFASVYRAEHVRLDSPCSVKVLFPVLAARREVVARFEREAKTTSRLRHPGIVSVVDFGEEPHVGLFLVMEYLAGETLEDRIDREGALPLGDLLAYGRAAAAALEVAHEEGVVHRDVKPSNLMLLAQARAASPLKVLDFGIATLLDGGAETALTRSGATVGSPAYMSPEQVRGEPACPRSDIYGLGVVLHEMATGTPPFRGETGMIVAAHQLATPPPPIRSVRPDLDLPEGLEAVVLCCLAKARDDRPDAMRVLRRSLEELQAATRHHPTARRRTAVAGAATVRATSLADASAAAPPVGSPTSAASASPAPAAAAPSRAARRPAPPVRGGGGRAAPAWVEAPWSATAAPPERASAVAPRPAAADSALRRRSLGAPCRSSDPDGLGGARRRARRAALGMAGFVAVSAALAVVLWPPAAGPTRPRDPLAPAAAAAASAPPSAGGVGVVLVGAAAATVSPAAPAAAPGPGEGGASAPVAALSAAAAMDAAPPQRPDAGTAAGPDADAAGGAASTATEGAPGTIRLDSEPPGAEVREGRVTLGRTPLDLRLAPDDPPRELLLRLRGFRWERVRLDPAGVTAESERGRVVPLRPLPPPEAARSP